MISYEEALEITEKSEAFYVQYGEVRGYQYAMFNYRMALYEDFINEDWDARELRGLTFINDTLLDEWVCYPMLQKFWNLNENVSTQYGLVKDKTVNSVEYKEDGSLITFIVLPNNEVVPKTKMSFDNDQTIMVENWMKENPKTVNHIRNFHHVSFLFELVSPRNKIVLKYPKTELRLLQIRHKLTGEYCTKVQLEYQASKMNVPLAETFNNTLDELLELRETQENIEGWVIKFSDGQMVKLKTAWYVAAHGLMDDLSKEHKVIEMIMNETIDDVLSELEEGSEEKEYIEEIMSLIEHYYNHRVQKVYDLRTAFYEEFNGVRKDFAMAHSKTPDFGVVMRNLEGDGIEATIKDRILIETAHLEKARDLLEILMDKSGVEL